MLSIFDLLRQPVTHPTRGWTYFLNIPSSFQSKFLWNSIVEKERPLHSQCLLKQSFIEALRAAFSGRRWFSMNCWHVQRSFESMVHQSPKSLTHDDACSHKIHTIKYQHWTFESIYMFSVLFMFGHGLCVHWAVVKPLFRTRTEYQLNCLRVKWFECEFQPLNLHKNKKKPTCWIRRLCALVLGRYFIKYS